MLPYEAIGDTGRNELRSLDGRLCIPFVWENEYSLDGESTVRLVHPANSRFPIGRTFGKGRVQSFTVPAVTVGDDTPALESLLSRVHVVGLVHSPTACEIDDCDVPLYQAVYVTAFPRSRTGHTDRQRTRWDLSMIPANPNDLGTISTYTWWDTNDEHAAWHEVDLMAEAFKGA